MGSNLNQELKGKNLACRSKENEPHDTQIYY